MAHDVFISHSSRDKQIAEAMCHKLESNGIRCWIAPRDILPGMEWGDAIIQAINNGRVMILVFSSNANDSQQIVKEVGGASSKRVPIVAFRIEDVQPLGSLEYYLSTVHWLDALTPQMEKHLNQLVESVKRLLQLPPRRTTPVPPSEAPTAADAVPRILKNRIGMEFMYVPPGDFMMGSENGPLVDRLLGNEKPVHHVTIREAFYMGKFQVTQAQWQQVMANNPSCFKGEENLPVERVSWDDANAFIAGLNAYNDGYTYRLPTEAEWEYACRAGTTGEYAGDLDSMAWYVRYYSRGKSTVKTYPVGSKQPNAFGLFDMHGNVWEWCQDWYHRGYIGAPADGSAWLSGGKQNYRVLRGGSWSETKSYLRSANRLSMHPNVRASNYGFRLVAVAQR